MTQKMCFLILAHTDPNQLRRLVYSLDYPSFDIFIHLDKKADIKNFDFDSYDLKYSKLTILDNRVKVYWGDYSIVEATLNLYKRAFITDDYCRFILISGLDYPIASNDEIYGTLLDLNKEFICGNPIKGKEFHKVSFHYFFKYKYLNSLCFKLRKILKVKINEKKQYLGLTNGKKLTVYFSPQWQALSQRCVEYLLTTYEQNPRIKRFFKYSYAPDELLIPTIVFNSTFKEKTLKSVFPENTHYNLKTAIHYLNYEPIIEVFDEKKFNEIVSSNKLFFRKAVTGKSDKLIEMINGKRNTNK